MCAQATADEQFFNRKHELLCLERLLASAPRRACITVIVGPPSSGKTALVQHYIQQLKEQEQQLPDSPVTLPIYVDCRVCDVGTPDSFAAALIRATTSKGQQAVDALAQFAALLFSNFSVRLKPSELEFQVKLANAADWLRLFKAQPCGTPLASILEEYTGGSW